MARRIEIISGGYQEVRHDGEQPETFQAGELIPFGRLRDLGGRRAGVFNLRKGERIPDEDEETVSQANEYADNMKAPFYELTFERKLYPGHGAFGGENFKKTIVHLEGKVQLYVHNKPAPKALKSMILLN